MVAETIKQYLTLIKFSHTLFALPFALISALLAARAIQLPYISVDSLQKLIWIVLAMVGARSGAMGFNRLVDRKWDRENPRTSNRPSVTGKINAPQMSFFVILSFCLLIFSAWNLNKLAFYLSPVAIVLVSGYSFTKHFTSFSHYFLGLAIGSSPIAAWIAVTGTFSLTAVIIGVAVFTWIAGFDVLYALQDLEYDRQAKLHSIPVKIGVQGSLITARLTHFVTVVCWVLIWRLSDLGFVFLGGIVLCICLLIWEHNLLRKDDLSKLDIAFFNMNAIISMTLFIALLIDILIEYC